MANYNGALLSCSSFCDILRSLNFLNFLLSDSQKLSLDRYLKPEEQTWHDIMIVHALAFGVGALYQYVGPPSTCCVPWSLTLAASRPYDRGSLRDLPGGPWASQWPLVAVGTRVARVGRAPCGAVAKMPKSWRSSLDSNAFII